MTKSDGKPCKKCGTSRWYDNRACAYCTNQRAILRYQEDKETWNKRSRHRERTKRESVRETARLWRQANPDKLKEYYRRQYHANKDSIREKNKKWYHDNPEANAAKHSRRSTKKNAAGGSYTVSEWRALVEHYGNKCLCCGRDDVKLTADHIVPIAKGGTSNIDNIQPLCGSCNSRKKDKTIDYRPGSGLGRWIQRKLFG